MLHDSRKQTVCFDHLLLHMRIEESYLRASRTQYIGAKIRKTEAALFVRLLLIAARFDNRVDECQWCYRFVPVDAADVDHGHRDIAADLIRSQTDSFCVAHRCE